MKAVAKGDRDLRGTPNLLFEHTGTIEDACFAHRRGEQHNDATVDRSYFRGAEARAPVNKLVMTLSRTRCGMDRPRCAGPRFAYRNIMGVRRTLIQKDNRRIVEELRTMGEAAKVTSIYARQCYSETCSRMHEYLDGIKEMSCRSVCSSSSDIVSGREVGACRIPGPTTAGIFARRFDPPRKKRDPAAPVRGTAALYGSRARAPMGG